MTEQESLVDENFPLFSRKPAKAFTKPVTTAVADDPISDHTQFVKDTSSNDDTSHLTFADLKLSDWALQTCKELGMKKPTPVQQHCIPRILSGEDVLGIAQTGSGKTAAFALPILHRLAEDPYGVFCLVVTPTRELAYQLAEQFKALGSCLHLRCEVIVGGMDMITQTQKLVQRPHVVICTPGRIKVLIEQNPDIPAVFSNTKFWREREMLLQFAVLEGTRDVTPTVLKSSTGLEVSKLSPKKWGLSRNSSIVLATFFGGLSYLIDHGVDLRPQLAIVLGLAMVDSIFLGGSCLAQISSYWPPYKRRILVHEAGHLLVAYLMGCPIRGVILDPIVAMQMGIQGQAGTQFWDENLQNELAEGRLTGIALDRYCMVLFGGIAAEALVYGEAEGGENDENLFRSICLLLEPPFSVAQMSNQARWSVLQSYNLLKWHKHAHQAAVKALESGGSLSVVIRSIEEAMATNR